MTETVLVKFLCIVGHNQGELVAEIVDTDERTELRFAGRKPATEGSKRFVNTRTPIPYLNGRFNAGLHCYHPRHGKEGLLHEVPYQRHNAAVVQARKDRRAVVVKLS